MNAVEPDEANETVEDLTDEQLDGVAAGFPSTLMSENEYC